MKLNIRILYLYLFSLVGLVIVVIGSINMVNLGLKTFIFKDADTYEIYEPIPLDSTNAKVVSVDEQMARQKRDVSRQRQRQLADSIAALVVGMPLYLYHWNTIKKESVKG